MYRMVLSRRLACYVRQQPHRYQKMDYPASGNLPMEQQASQVFAIERNHVLVVEPTSMFRQLWKPFLVGFFANPLLWLALHHLLSQ